MEKIFLSDKVNTGRQYEVDLSRGFTAILLIICHVGLYLGNTGTNLYTFCDIIGSEFSAPVFMTLMGISCVFSSHQKPLDLLLRGVKLLLSGYALSAVRTLIPLWIFGNIDEWTTTAAFFVVDIMQLAGLSFLFLALLKKLKVHPLLILLLSMLMVGLAQILMAKQLPHVSSEIVGYFVNLFCPVTDWSCFPFLIWFFFPALGLNFGELLLHCKNKDKLYGIMLPVGVAGVLYVYYQFYRLYPDYPTYYFGNNFYYMGLKNVLLTAFFIGTSLSFWYFAGKIPAALGKKFLTFLSKNLNLFYWISWVIVSALIHIKAITGWSLSDRMVVALTVLILLICAVATKLCQNIRANFSVAVDKKEETV